MAEPTTASRSAIDVQMAWNQFKTPALKQFKMMLPYIVTDGNPRTRST